MLKSVLEKLAGLERRRSAWLPRLVIPESEKRPGFRHGLRLARNEAGVPPYPQLACQLGFETRRKKGSGNSAADELQA